MAGIYEKLIRQAAKEALAPLGFFQVGRSRKWVRDGGWYFTAVDFAPSSYNIPGAGLWVFAHYLWDRGPGFPDTDTGACDLGGRLEHTEEYTGDDEAFQAKMREFAAQAAEKVALYAPMRDLARARAFLDHPPKGTWKIPYWDCWDHAMYCYLMGDPVQGDAFLERAQAHERDVFGGLSRKEYLWRYAKVTPEQADELIRSTLESPEYLFGQQLLALPPEEKQPFVLAGIARKRQCLRGKVSWRKLGVDPVYG